MSNNSPLMSPGGEIVVYESPDGEVSVDVRLEQETVWLTQRQLAEVFDTSTDNIGLHLKNVYSSVELEEKATTGKSSVVQTEGKCQVQHYNLDAIVSVGYRVSSKQGVYFRQWATRTLREHLVRGFTMNESQLAKRGLQEAPRDARPTCSDAPKPGIGGRHRASCTGTHRQLRRYTWHLLLAYDEGWMDLPPSAKPVSSALNYECVVRDDGY